MTELVLDMPNSPDQEFKDLRAEHIALSPYLKPYPKKDTRGCDSDTKVWPPPWCRTVLSVQPGEERDGRTIDWKSFDFAGDTVGRYQLVERIGNPGGFGVVYSARRREFPNDDPSHAIKLISQHNENWRVEQREFRGLYQLFRNPENWHDNIVHCFDFGECSFGDEWFHYLVMERIHGENLDQYVKLHGPLAWDEAFSIAGQLLAALDHAATILPGFVHRDIKPANLMRDQSGKIKLIDWGLIHIHDDVTHSQDCRSLGTPHYSAPETDLGTLDDPRSDLYAVGGVIHFLLTGHPLFGNKKKLSPFELRRAHQEGVVERGDLPEDAAELLYDRLLSKSPTERFDNYREAGLAIQQVLADLRFSESIQPMMQQSLGNENSSPITKVQSFDKPNRHRPALLIACASMLFVFGFLVIFANADGKLIVKQLGKNARVSIWRGGEVIQIVDEQSGSEIKLSPGKYDLKLEGTSNSVQITPTEVVLTRWGTTVATVSSPIKDPPPAPSSPRKEAVLSALDQFDLPESVREAAAKYVSKSPDRQSWSFQSADQQMAISVEPKPKTPQLLAGEKRKTLYATIALLAKYEAVRSSASRAGLTNGIGLSEALGDPSFAVPFGARIEGLSQSAIVSKGYIVAFSRCDASKIVAALTDSNIIDDLKSSYQMALTKRSETLIKEQQWGKSLELWRHLHDLKLTTPELYLNAVDCFLQLEQQVDALVVMEEFVDVFSDLQNWRLWERLGQLAMQIDDERSRGIAEKAYQHAVDNFSIHDQ